MEYSLKYYTIYLNTNLITWINYSVSNLLIHLISIKFIIIIRIHSITKALMFIAIVLF